MGGESKTWQPGEIPTAAKVWDQASDGLKTAKAAPEKVKFGKADMGLAVMVHEVYEGTRSGVEKLMTSAVEETAAMSQALTGIEQDYAENQGQNKQNIDNVDV